MNMLSDFYVAHWICGYYGYPTCSILVMPSKHGKSLTTYRFYSVRDEIIVIPQDTTAQSYRRLIANVYSRDKLNQIELIILEDWTKVRDKVKEPTAAELVKFSTGIYSLDQMDLQIKPTRVSCSIIINVTPARLRDLLENISKVGGGDRFNIYEFGLSGNQKKKLDKLGFMNRKKSVLPMILPLTNNTINYERFSDAFYNDVNNTPAEVNLAYGCQLINNDLFKNIKKLQRNKVIREIEWKEYWE